MKHPSFFATNFIFLTTVLIIGNVCTAQLLSIRDDKTLLKDGQPWFPILNIYHPISMDAVPGDSSLWFTPRYWYYDSSAACGFNGVILHYAWGGRAGVCPFNSYRANNSISFDLPNGQNLCEGENEEPLNVNMGLRNGDTLRSYFGRTNRMFFDDGLSYIPYGMLANETPIGPYRCTAADPTAKRHAATDFVLAHNNHASPFAGFYSEERNNVMRDWGDQRWGQDDLDALAAMFMEQHDYIKQQDSTRLIFHNFSPSTAARVVGITEDNTVVPRTGPLGREYWLRECRALAAAADIVGVDWYLNCYHNPHYQGDYDILENVAGYDSSCRTVGVYAHLLVDSIAEPLGKSTIFTMNNHDRYGPIASVSKLKSTWIQAFVAGVKGFAVYSWVCYGDDAEHRQWRHVIGEVFRPLNEWGVLAAWNAATQPSISAGAAVLEQLTKQVGDDQWTFAVDRSPEGFSWPYSATFSGYNTPTGPVEVFKDGQDYVQRWLWPSSGAFSDEFNRLQAHIYRIYHAGLHDTVFINTSLDVPAGNTLVINSGTVIRFAPGAQLTVNGRIEARGTEQNPIRLTSADPLQRWGGVFVESADTGNILEHVEIMKATTAVYVRNGYLKITDSEIHSNTHYGVVYTYSDGVIENCRIEKHLKYGVFIADGHVSLKNNEITDGYYGGVRVVRGDHYLGYNEIHANGHTEDDWIFPRSGLQLLGAHGTLRCNDIHDNAGPGLFVFCGGYADMRHAWNDIYDNMQAADTLGADFGQIHFQGGLAGLGDGWNSIYSAPDTGVLIGNSLIDSVSVNLTYNHWGTNDSANIAGRLPAGSAFLPLVSSDLTCMTVPLDTGHADPVEALFNQGWDQEHQGLFQAAKLSYDSLIKTYPQSDFADAALDRLYYCEKGIGMTWEEIREYFLDLAADSSTDTSLVNQCLSSAAWCLVNLGEFDAARYELEGLIDSTQIDADYLRNMLYMLLLELKEDYTNGLFSVQTGSNHDRDGSGGLDAAPIEAMDAHTAKLTTFSDKLDALVRIAMSANERAPEKISIPLVPAKYMLYQNYPNPFNPVTEIRFDLPERADVELRVFNLLGQEIAMAAKGCFVAGSHTVRFDGGGLASGVYIYSLKANDYRSDRKMILLK